MKKTLIIFILIVGLSVFILTVSDAFAYTSESSNTSLSLINPFDFLKNDILKSAAQNTGISTTVPSLPIFKQFLDTKNLSFNDISGSLKAIGALAINLFLIVIQTVAGILKALLPFLSK